MGGGGGVGGALGFYSISVDVSPLYSRLFTLTMLVECSLHFGMENSGSYVSNRTVYLIFRSLEDSIFM